MQDQRFRRRLVALAQAQQQKTNPQIIINTESRSLEQQRDLNVVKSTNYKTNSGVNTIQKDGLQYQQVGTAREVQTKPADRLIMVVQKQDALLNSVREVPMQNQMLRRNDQISPEKRSIEHNILHQSSAQNGLKNVMTTSSNEGSAIRSLNNGNQQKQHVGSNQLSNSVQFEGSRRMGQRNKKSQLSGSIENGTRNIQPQKLGSGQLVDHQGVPRRRQPNVYNNMNIEMSAHKVETNNNFSAEVFQSIGNAKPLSNNTTGSQILKQEIKEINKGLREGQKSQTILIQTNNQNQKSLSQIQNRLSTDNKSSGARKPSRGHQKVGQNPNQDKYLTTNDNQKIFSTPALNTDSSQTSLPAANVIFHPHPLNNNLQQSNAKSVEGARNVGFVTAQNKKINFNATTTLNNQQTASAIDSGRPQSQKVTIPFQQNQQTMNNRNSRKNLRPIGKKGSQHGSQNNLKHKPKNPSKEQYMTNNDANIYQKQKLSNNQIGQNLKGYQSLVQANQNMNFHYMQNKMSASTSRERAIAMGGMHFAQTQTGQFMVNQNQVNKVKPKDLIYQTNAASLQQPTAGGQMTNITNKNVLFKFKKNVNGASLGSQQKISISQSNFQPLNSEFHTTNPIVHGQPPQIPPNVAAQAQKSARRGNFAIHKAGGNGNGGANSLQNTQPLNFETQMHQQNQLMQASNLVSQRSHGPDIQMSAIQIVKKPQKMQMAQGLNNNLQNTDSKKLLPSNMVTTYAKNTKNSKLRQRSIQDEDRLNPMNNQVDQLNQLSEIGIVEQHSKEESVVNNPLLMMEPSQHTPIYGNNFEAMVPQHNEISSFNEMVGQAGLSSLSGIEQIVAEGSQLSRMESNEAHFFMQDKYNKGVADGKISVKQLNTDNSNPLLEGFGDIMQNEQINTQAKTITQSARQSSIDGHHQKNHHFLSTNEGGVGIIPKLSKPNSGQPKSNESSKQTTVLGSLTSNFQVQNQKQQFIKSQNNTQKLLQGQSNSQQQIPTIQQINGIVTQHNNIVDSARGVSSSVAKGQMGKGNGQPSTATINSKLIKINKSKKMVDSARRSRIRQLDGHNSQTQENLINTDVINPSEGVAGFDNLKLATINSNGPQSQLQQKVKVNMPTTATHFSNANKQNFFSGSQPVLNFNNTQQIVNPLQSNPQSLKFSAPRLNSHRQQQENSNSAGRNITLKSSNIPDHVDNNYMSNTTQVAGAHLQSSASNKLQLTMNINTSAGQFNTAQHEQLQGVKQANTQKNNGGKLNILSYKKHSSNTNNNSSTKAIKVNQVQGQLPLVNQNNALMTSDQMKQSIESHQQLQGANTQNVSGQGYIEDLTGIANQFKQSNATSTQRTLPQNDTYQMQATKSARDQKSNQLTNSYKPVNARIVGQRSSQTRKSQEHLDPSTHNTVNNGSLLNSNKSVPRVFGQTQIKKQTLTQGQLISHHNVKIVKPQINNDKNQEKSDIYTESKAVKIENQTENGNQKTVKNMTEANSGVGSKAAGQQLILPEQNEIEQSARKSSQKKQEVNNQANNFIHVQNQQNGDQTQAPQESQVVQKDNQPSQEYSQQNTQMPVVKTVNKVTEQRTTMDTNSNRKQTTDSQQRTNFNTSMQNIPRGLINTNTAFSLSSVTSKDEVIPPLPTTPQNILRYYIQELTDYEKGEVLDYEMIYFLGNSKQKKVDQKAQKADQKQDQQQKQEKKSKSSCSNKAGDGDKSKDDQKFVHNYGYDDEKGDYKIVVGDHIGYRYEIVEFLGKGSFGTALGCIDHKENKEVAVKIVKNKKKYYYQASVELKILQYLRQHDHEDIMNVIHIEDYVVFRKHLCMSFERLSMNLFEFLKINDFNGFDHNLIRRFAIQLLYALKYLKQLEIIHCDLKPENILLKEENKSGIKIIDFGSSTFIDEKVYTYIQSRFYRAPEIMLGIPYTPAIDMWSLGCIMAELYIGYPLFPGESENDQMSRIMEMRDVPPKEVLAISERKQKFFKENNGVLEPVMLKNSKGKYRKANGKPLDYVIGDEDPDFNDFVSKCLNWNPQTRLSPDDALKHVWVLKGLPPQVLIHHQKMHNIATPELPKSVKVARDEFLIEQQKEQELIMQQQRKTRAQRFGNKQQETTRDISYNPNAGRPQIQLKTPRENNIKNSLGNSNQKLLQRQFGDSQERNNNKNGGNMFPIVQQMQNQTSSTGSQFNILKQNSGANSLQQSQLINSQRAIDDLNRSGGAAQGNSSANQSNENQNQQSGSTRRKFVIKKVNK